MSICYLDRASSDATLAAPVTDADFRDLVEDAHDLIWFADAAGCWLYLNRACESLYGYTAQELVGRSMLDMQAAGSSPGNDTKALLTAVLEGREVTRFEVTHRDRDEEVHFLSFNARAVYDAGGRLLHLRGTARDITAQKGFEKQLAYQAEHDALTAVYNRRYFQQELDRVVARVARSGETCALLYIDLDQFKYINDTLGHPAGDRLLIEVSRLIEAHVRDGDLVSRFGGDEFTVLLYNVDAEHAVRVAEHLRHLLGSHRFIEKGNIYSISCSLGAVLIDNETLSGEDALAQADLACNAAKGSGRNRVKLYDPHDRYGAVMAQDIGWAGRLRGALEQELLQLVYQPIAQLSDGRIHHYEVLLRMEGGNGQILVPSSFMPVAERFGLIHSIDRWVVRRAIATLAELHAQSRPLHFAINLSGRAFEDNGLLPLIRAALRDGNLDPAVVTFEITETAAISNMASAIRFISALKDIGCRFALDDFGSGFSSFSYLKHLPVDNLKIDGSFVRDLAHTPVDQSMVQAMNQVAHALGKVTIAEWVQDEDTLNLLRDYGVDYVQGYHIGRPQPLAAL